ncbi:MAG TPA: FAD-dependent oxidoreductase [Pseudoclavibacter sp.]|nr:FAD-dependent oxidoreductase [Pseudoclavibacter sp.]
MHNGGVSFWWQQVGIPAARPALDGPESADVCIVGAGYTGLWTAYYLKTLKPDWTVVVLERRFAGFGASGRNGGWLTNSVTGGRGQFVAQHGRAAAEAQQRAMNETVDEVIRVAAAEGIDADIVAGGELNVAFTPAQMARMQGFAREEQSWESTDLAVLTAAQVSERIRFTGALGGTWHPHCARIHPAKLVAGLAAAVERLGVVIYENSGVTEIRPGIVETDHGSVAAGAIVRATEGFTADLPAEHRTWLPMNSSIIVTEPLSDAIWESIGWEGREVYGDYAHVYMYAQRTADNRIAFGGRGVPYRFGSRTDNDGTTAAATVRHLTDLLHRMLPQTSAARVEHAWSGVLGVPRDWAATVCFDPATRIGWAGGYVGTGVATTNLAGRTLADLICGRDTDITRLPWVGHVAQQWEPEPLRWVGVRGMYAAYSLADRIENRGRPRTSIIARLADTISGMH